MRAHRYTLSALAGLICLWAAPTAHGADRVYWTDDGGSKLSFANVNGGGGDLYTAGATALDNPLGVAVDPAAGRVYWANYAGNTISFANLNGTGGGDVPTGSATVNHPVGLAIDSATGRIYWA